MNYANIKYNDIANGPGVRTSLFVSGCRLHCKGCFNALAWDFNAGNPFNKAVQDKILTSLSSPYVDGLTILGGEPFEPENQEVLAPFIERVHRELPDCSLWMFSGHTWEELAQGAWHTPYTDSILSCLDVLVDGPWQQENYDITLRFRGSSNQRLIDVPSTLEAHAAGELCANEVILWRDDPLFETHDFMGSLS